MPWHIIRNIYKMLTLPCVNEDIVWKRKREIRYDATLTFLHVQLVTTVLLTRNKL